MIFQIFIAFIFHIYFLVLLISIMKTRNLFAFIHASLYIMLVPLLQITRFFSPLFEQYEFSYFLLSYFVVLFYLVIFASGTWLMRKKLPDNEMIIKTATGISDFWLSLSFYMWLGIKTYLFFQYEAGAFVDFSHFSILGTDIQYTVWETPVITFSSALSVGASIVYVIKIAIDRQYIRKPGLLIPFLLYISVNFLAHDISIGPRRFLFILFLVLIFVIIQKGQRSLSDQLKTTWSKIVMIGILVSGLAGYYQLIRNNIYQPEIADLLRSPHLADFSKGLVKIIVIVPEEERMMASAPFFREGPFDVLYEVITALGNGNQGTHGEITYNSFLMVMPRLLVGDQKTNLNADDFFASKMNIMPSGNYSKPDIATSMPAIFIADFGVTGVLFTPIIMLFSLYAINKSLANKTFTNPVLLLFIFSLMVNIAGNVEGDLVGILANFRNLVLLFLLSLPFMIIFPRKTLL